MYWLQYGAMVSFLNYKYQVIVIDLDMCSWCSRGHAEWTQLEHVF